MSGGLRIKNLPVNTLVPHAKNARTHSDAQIDQIVASIEAFGFNNPVLVDEDSSIIAGHGRVLAAQHLRLKTIPCIVLPHLSPAQKEAYVLADNKLALNAGWDESLLKDALVSVADFGIDLELTGFSPQELTKFGIGEGGLNDTGPRTVEIGSDRHLLLIECEDEASIAALFDEMKERGVECKVLD